MECIPCGRARSEPSGTQWRMGGEVKGKLTNGVGSQYSHATTERGLSSITQDDEHTSAASSRLKWRPHRFKWTSPFRGKTKSGFCACAFTFRTSYNSSFVLLPEAVVLAVQPNQLFLPWTKWPEKLVSKVIITLSGKSEVVICFTAIFITALGVLWYGLHAVNVHSCL